LKLYENVVIGNFLYCLGHSIGTAFSTKRQLSVINLLQQTPADKELGDMLLEFPGVVRLIEFKNKANISNKEKERFRRLTVAIGANETMQNISREIHWYVETEPFQELCLNNINPYLDAFSSIDSIYTIESFIESITKSVVAQNNKPTSDDYGAYLSLVACCQGSGTVGTGGLVVSVGKDGIRYLQFTNIMQLRLQHKDYVKQCMNDFFESIMKKSLEKEHALVKENSLGRSR